MLEIIGFVVVLAVVFAVKAAAIMRNGDELAGQCASFSWMSMRAQDEARASAWAAEEKAAAAAMPARAARASMGRVRGLSA